MGASPDLVLTGRGWRRIKRAWNNSTPEQRKTFAPGPEIIRMTRADAQAAVVRQKRAALEAMRPRPKKIRTRIKDGFLHVMGMMGIMAMARQPQLPGRGRGRR